MATRTYNKKSVEIERLFPKDIRATRNIRSIKKMFF